MYKWLGISDCAGLTPKVRDALKEIGQAMLWDYQGKCEVVHYVCPVFPKEAVDAEEALQKLTDVYIGVFKAFAEAEGTTLRMAPCRRRCRGGGA